MYELENRIAKGGGAGQDRADMRLQKSFRGDYKTI